LVGLETVAPRRGPDPRDQGAPPGLSVLPGRQPRSAHRYEELAGTLPTLRLCPVVAQYRYDYSDPLRPRRHLGRKLGAYEACALLVRVDSGFSWAASLEGGEACGLHETLFRELLDPFLVSGAPDAPWFARGESDRISPVVDALTHAVDPSEAERLIDRLRPGN